MYELFVLGELMDEPMHGYLLRDIVNLAIGPLRQMSWGVLYPLIRGLEEEGLVEQAPEEGASTGRPRKVYRITQSGQARFFHLLLKHDEYTADYTDLFNIKLVNFDHLNPEQQLEILRHYRDYVQFLIDHHHERAQMIANNPNIGQSERHWIQRVLTHRLTLAEADLAWVEAEMARVSAFAGQST